MNDQLNFELQFADAFERYLAGAPVDVEPAEVTAMAVANPVRGLRLADRLGLPSPYPSRRTAVFAAVGLLVLVLGATLLIVGPLLSRPRLGGDHLLVTNGAYDCQNLFRYDIRTASS